MAFTYKYARPAVTVDAALFGLDAEDLKILLIQRGREPHKGQWALPGGFIRVGEAPDVAVARELKEETGIRVRRLVQLGAYGDPKRDPREHVISLAFLGLTPIAEHRPKADTDAHAVAWHSLDDLPALAFDHADIVNDAVDRLRLEAETWELGRDLLPAKFPMRDLQLLHERILSNPLDKRNFRRDALASGILVELDEWESDVNHRAARLYSFTKRNRK